MALIRLLAALGISTSIALALIMTGAVSIECLVVVPLGALICDLNGVSVKIGGGFTDQQREEIWAMWLHDQALGVEPGPGTGHKLLGRLIEVEYHEITPDGSLRHPRFICFRDDKDDGAHLEAA